MKLDKTADKFVKLFAAEILITSGKSALHLQKSQRIVIKRFGSHLRGLDGWVCCEFPIDQVTWSSPCEQPNFSQSDGMISRRENQNGCSSRLACLLNRP